MTPDLCAFINCTNRYYFTENGVDFSYVSGPDGARLDVRPDFKPDKDVSCHEWWNCAQVAPPTIAPLVAPEPGTGAMLACAVVAAVVVRHAWARWVR